MVTTLTCTPYSSVAVMSGGDAGSSGAAPDRSPSPVHPASDMASTDAERAQTRFTATPPCYLTVANSYRLNLNPNVVYGKTQHLSSRRLLPDWKDFRFHSL